MQDGVLQKFRTPVLNQLVGVGVATSRFHLRSGLWGRPGESLGYVLIYLPNRVGVLGTVRYEQRREIAHDWQTEIDH